VLLGVGGLLTLGQARWREDVLFLPRKAIGNPRPSQAIIRATVFFNLRNFFPSSVFQPSEGRSMKVRSAGFLLSVCLLLGYSSSSLLLTA
jgi:hypothetical protein